MQWPARSALPRSTLCSATSAAWRDTSSCAKSCTPGATAMPAPFRIPRHEPFFPCRSEEHPSELQSLMRNSYADFCLKQKQNNNETHQLHHPSIIHNEQQLTVESQQPSTHTS